MQYDPILITGPVVIVEDDPDDRFFLEQIFAESHLTQYVVYFVNPALALTFLMETEQQPFIIMSDINLPLMSGMEFKRKIDQDPMLREKSIPFVFVSTAATNYIVKQAYSEFFIQGFFQKDESYEKLKQSIYRILDYWQYCKHPNNA